MNPEDKVKFAIVGCGHIGKRHAAMIMENKEAAIAAFCDTRDPNELGLQDFKNVPFYSSIEALLDSSTEFDIVSICSPNGLHADHCLKALNKKKHVVCEKPMALTKQK